jgi:hypothetical protein
MDGDGTGFLHELPRRAGGQETTERDGEWADYIEAMLNERTDAGDPVFTDAAIIGRSSMEIWAHSAGSGRGRVTWELSLDEVHAIKSLVEKVERAGNVANALPMRVPSLDPLEGVRLQGYSFIVGRSGEDFGQGHKIIMLISKDPDVGRTPSTLSGRKNCYIRATSDTIFVAMCPFEVARHGLQRMERLCEYIQNSGL